MVSTRRPAAVLGALALGALALGPGSAAAATPVVEAAIEAPGGVRLSAPMPADGGLSVLARVPDALTGQPLQDSAFSARQGDRPVAVTVERVVDGPAQLVLGFDTSEDAAALLAEQSAAADLLRTLPMDLPTVVLPGGTGGTVLNAFVRIGALRPGAGGLLEGLGSAPEGSRFVVLLTGCPSLQEAAASEAADELRSAAQVHVLVLGSGCEQLAAELAGPSGGVARTGLGAGRLVAAVDAVSREVNGTYRLRLDADPMGEPVLVRAFGAGSTAEGRLELPSSAPASATADGGRDDVPALPVAVAAGLLVLVAAGVGIALRTGRRAA